MFASGLVELAFGVAAEGKSLEDIASPLSATNADNALNAAPPAKIPRTTWAPRPQVSRYPASDPYRLGEVDEVVRVLKDAGTPLSYSEIARRTSGRYWGPGRLRGALRGAVYSGRVRPLGGDKYVYNKDEDSGD